MIYIFQGLRFLRKEVIDRYGDSEYDINQFNHWYPKAIPTDSYVFDKPSQTWYVKRTGRRVRLLHSIPKELEMLSLVIEAL